MCFATLALVTDYDCWNADAGDVAIDDVLRILSANVEAAQRLLSALAEDLDSKRLCACGRALENAIITDPARIPEETRRDLGLLIGKYLARRSS
jgi:5'-methylthioadenosine phosphorylase